MQSSSGRHAELLGSSAAEASSRRISIVVLARARARFAVLNAGKIQDQSCHADNLSVWDNASSNAAPIEQGFNGALFKKEKRQAVESRGASRPLERRDSFFLLLSFPRFRFFFPFSNSQFRLARLTLISTQAAIRLLPQAGSHTKRFSYSFTRVFLPRD